MKNLTKILVLCLMVFVMVAASACSILNQHEFSTEWENDANNHWHACIDDGCEEISDKAAHTYDAGTVTTPATEDAEGVKTFKCTVCGYEKTEVIEKLVHTHNLTKVAEVAATCTESGTNAYYTCSGCDKLFADAEGATEIEAPEAITALGHTDETVKGQAATCTATGLTDGKKCSVCGKTLVAQTEIPKANHTEETVAGKDATCTATGLTEGKKCSVCGETLVAQNEIPKANHAYDNEQDESCNNCGFIRDVNCEHTNTTETVAGKDATCTETGLKDGKKCSVCGAIIVAQDVIPVISHTPAEAVKENEVAATCKAAGSYDSVVKCASCGTEISRDTISTPKLDHSPAEAVKENEIAATCKEDGSYDSVVKCASCGTEISRNTISTPKLDHSPAEAVKENVVAPTADAAGSYDSIVNCSVCGAEISKDTVVLPSFNGTDYNTTATYGSDSKGTATVTYTLKADENFTYSVDYTSNLAIKVDGTLNRYVPDTLDAIDIPNLIVTYVEATDSSAAYYSFAASGGTATVEKLLAYGDAPVVITGDVVINQNEKISNNGGFIVGSADLPGTVTINQAATQDGMQMWNSAYVTIENGTLTINGYEGIASGKTAIYSSGCAFNIKENGKFVVNYYNNYFTGSATLNFDSDFIADKGIGCKSITSTARFIVDNGAAVNVTGNLGASEYTVHMKKGLDKCVNENAEFGYDHALFIKNGSMTITGNLRCASAQVGSMLGDGTKGTLTVNSNGDALTRDSGNVQYDFANGDVSFTSSNAKKSLIMVNNASAVVTVNVMKNCIFTADNYSLVFYLNAGNNVSSFNYYEANLVTTNCANMFSASVQVNLLTDEG